MNVREVETKLKHIAAQLAQVKSELAGSVNNMDTDDLLAAQHSRVNRLVGMAGDAVEFSLQELLR